MDGATEILLGTEPKAPASGAASAGAEFDKLIADGGQIERRRRLRFGFKVAGLGMLVPHQCISEVVATPAIHHLPGLPKTVLGLINNHGEVAPVFDVAAVMEPQPKPEPLRYVIMLDKGDKLAGLKLDTLPATLNEMQRDENFDEAPEFLRPYLVRTYLAQNQRWYDFQHTALFAYLAGS